MQIDVYVYDPKQLVAGMSMTRLVSPVHRMVSRRAFLLHRMIDVCVVPKSLHQLCNAGFLEVLNDIAGARSTG